MLRDADTAMYRAKAEGKARYVMFDPQMHAAAVTRLTLESDIRGALARGELRLQYQPMVGLADRRATGVEALLRWHHPRIGLIPPTDFIPLAEETGGTH